MMKRIIISVLVCFASLAMTAQGPGKFNQNFTRQRYYGVMGDTLAGVPIDTFRTAINVTAYKNYPWLASKTNRLYLWDVTNYRFNGIGFDSIYVRTSTDSVFGRYYGVEQFLYKKDAGAGVYVDTIFSRNDTLIYKKNNVEFAVRKVTDVEAVQDAVGAMINASLQYVDGTPLLAVNDRDFGDIIVSGSGLIWTIGEHAVSYDQIQTVSAIDRVLGRKYSTGSVEELTGADVMTMLDVFTDVANGITPASGGGTSNFLRADGTWAAPPGGSGTDNTNLGSGYRLLVPSSQGIKTLFNGFAVLLDSTTNTNGITAKVDTSLIASQFDILYKLNTSDSASMLSNYLRGATAGYGMLITGSQHKTWTVDSFSLATRAVLYKVRDSLGTLISTPTLQQVFNTEVGGSVLTKSDSIQTGAFNLKVFGATTHSFNGLFQVNQTSTGRAMSITGGSGLYIFPSSGSGGLNVEATGGGSNIISTTTGGIAVWAQGYSSSVPIVASHYESGSNQTGLSTTIQMERSITSGSVADYIGQTLDFRIRLTDGTASLAPVRLAARWNNATNSGNNESEFLIISRHNSANDTTLRLYGSGQFALPKYTTGGSFKVDDTTSYKPMVTDANGMQYRFNHWPGTGGGSTPTLQQVFDVETGEALMDKNDTINTNGNKLFIKSLSGLGGGFRSDMINGSSNSVFYNDYSNVVMQVQHTGNTGLGYLGVGIGQVQMYGQKSNSGNYSEISIGYDSISIKPDNGEINIDSLRDFTDVNYIIGWDSRTGATGRITLGTNLSFSGSTLNATGGGGGVTSVAAGFGTSFTTITSTGSVIVDTTSGGVQSWVRGKKITDSLNALWGVYRVDASKNITGGSNNYGALTSAADNVAIGYNMFNSLTSGARNINIGKTSLTRVTTATDLINLGYRNQTHVTTGAGNSMTGISIGNDNNGFITYKNLTIGSNNIGYNVDSVDARAYSRIVADNMAIGVENLLNLYSGVDNMVFSWGGLESLDSGSNNLALAQYALPILDDGWWNIGIGHKAGFRIQHGDRNIFLGDSSGKGAGPGTTMNSSIFIGSRSRYTGTNLYNRIAIGDSALVSQDNFMALGRQGTRVGIGRATADEQLHLDSAIVIGPSAASNDGTIRYQGGDFEGRKAGSWVSLTAGAGGGSGTVSSGVAGKAAYYPTSTTTVDDFAYVDYATSGTNVTITQNNTTDVALKIIAASSSAEDLARFVTSGGTTLTKITKEGYLSVPVGASTTPSIIIGATGLSYNATFDGIAVQGGTITRVAMGSNGFGLRDQSMTFDFGSANLGGTNGFRITSPAVGTMQLGKEAVLQSMIFKIANNSGSNQAGFDLTIQSGAGTGTSTTDGDIVLETPDATGSGTTVQSFTPKFEVQRTGQLKANLYGSGTFTGTAAKWLAVTAAGLIIEENAPGGSGGHTIQEEGTPLTARAALNFIGAGVTAADDAGNNATTVTIDADLNTIAGLTATTDNFLVSVSSAWASRTPSQVRTTLGLVIGTNVQAWDADLDTWAGVTPGTGVGTFLATPSSANLRSAVTDENGTGALLFSGSTSASFTTPVLDGSVTGTGVATGATASTLAKRDGDANITANNWLGGYTTTTTAAGTTTLTVGSTYLQFFTGSTTQTVTLPVASTLTLGHQFVIVNNSSGSVTINSSGGNQVAVLAGITTAVITCILTSGTSATSWNPVYDPINATGGKKVSFGNTITYNGTDGTTMTFPTTSATIARTDAAQTFTGVQTLSSAPVLSTGTVTVSGNTITFPGAAGTLATLAGTETLSGKTLTAPKFASAGFIADNNGNELIIFTTTSSAVNEITLANGATGNNATITASGETNTGITITGKGTKGVSVGNALLEKTSTVTDGAGAVIDASLGNYFTWTAAADRTAGTTTNPTTGQKMIIAFTASGGTRTLTLPTATTGDFIFGTDITGLTATSSGKTDLIGCIYNGTRWQVVAYTKGF